MSAKILKMIADMKAQLQQLESALTAKQAVIETAKQTVAEAAAVVKPKRQLSEGMKAWHIFNARIDTLLDAHNLKFHRVAEAKQFASMIHKNIKQTAIDMSDDEILTARERWTVEHKPTCAVCKGDTDDVSQHAVCGASFVTEFMKENKGTKEEGMTAWMKASGLKMPKADSDSEGEQTVKKAGRPKMTDEQKAAAAAAKAAMTPEDKEAAAAKRAAAKAARQAKTGGGAAPSTPEKKKKVVAPGAPKKLAWEPSGQKTPEEELIEEIDTVIQAM